MKKYLKELSIEKLMELSTLSESDTFDNDSIVRKIVEAENNNFSLGLIMLRNALFLEITNRYYDKLNTKP